VTVVSLAFDRYKQGAGIDATAVVGHTRDLNSLCVSVDRLNESVFLESVDQVTKVG
jgi:hypothetical protein